MGARKKYVVVAVAALLAGVAAVVVISHLDIQGYALLPLVLLAGLGFYLAWMAIFCVFVPPKRPLEEGLADTLLYLLFEHFLH